MLSKCTNPGCSAPFLYLSRGRLFRWETPSGAKGDGRTFGADPQAQSTARRIEFFWLCEDCAATMTLIFEKGAGVVARPRLRAKAAAAAATSARSVHFLE
jgi:hypothetical protein